jgi:hypothetical protein
MRTILLATVAILGLAAAGTAIPERTQGTSGNGPLQQSPRWRSLQYPACYSGEWPSTECRAKEQAPWYWTRRV